MKTLHKIVHANVTPRLLVGALVIFFLYRGLNGQQPTKTASAKPMLPIAQAYLAIPQKSVDFKDKIIELAKTDHITLLQWAMQNYKSRIQDYSVTLLKQERINGKLKKTEHIAVQFKDEPYSLMMEWEKNPGAIDKLLYVEGQNDNQMVVHPSGLFFWIKSVKRDPHDKEVKKASRNTPDQFGFYRSMENILNIYEKAKKNNDLKTAYLGKTEVHGRPCVSIERLLPPKREYPYARLVMDIDLDYLLPISISCYDWQGKLLGRYSYVDLKINTGLTAANFTPKANGL